MAFAVSLLFLLFASNLLPANGSVTPFEQTIAKENALYVPVEHLLDQVRVVDVALATGFAAIVPRVAMIAITRLNKILSNCLVV